ncbi:ECF transporter S component [candidate division KSB1 bacterium]|nr:ECF transporter S component [candidate division KSB1 bacterium]
MFKKITTLEAVFAVLMAVCGIASKIVVGPLARLIATPFLMPSGAIAGAIYLLWPMLALLVVRHFGIAMLVGLFQGIIVLITGFYGSHGILSLITYIVPCLFIDLSFWMIRDSKKRWVFFLPTAIGNVVGSFLVGYFFLRLPQIPLLMSLIPAFIFGGIGGVLARELYEVLIRTFPQFAKSSELKNSSCREKS